jgi:amino acid transporter
LFLEQHQELHQEQQLKRALTLKNLTIFGMIAMIPLAPFQLYGYAAQASYGMVPLVYLIGAILMFFTALSYARFSKEFPYAGSVYSYIGKGLNQHIGFLAGWTMLSDYILCPALACLFSGMWMSSIVPSIDFKVWAIAFLLFSAIVNARGIEMNAKANAILFWMQIVALIVFVALGIKFVFIDGHGTGGFSLSPIFQAEHINWSFIANATSIILLGFIGFDGISTLAEEAKDPKKTIGQATILCLVIISTLFFTLTYTASLAHPDFKNLNPDTALFDITKEIGGSIFYYAMVVVNVLALGIACTLNIQSAVSRILYSMGRDNILPGSKFFKKIHPKFQTPVNAIIFSTIVCIVVSFLADVNTIVMFVNFGALTAFMVLNLSVIVFFFIKKKERGLKGFIFHLLFPLIGFAICAFVWSGFDKKTWTVGFLWILVGAVIGFIKSKGYKEASPTIENL